MQRLQGRAFDQVTLGQQQTIRHHHLAERLPVPVELCIDMGRRHGGHHTIHPEAVVDEGRFHQGVNHRRRIGNASGLDHDPVQRGNLMARRTPEQLLQRPNQVALHAAAHTPRVEQHDGIIHLLDQVVVDPDVAQFIDQHRRARQRWLRQQMVEQGAFARPQKTGQHDDRSSPVGLVGRHRQAHARMTGSAARNPLERLMPFLRLQAQGRGRAREQAGQADRFSGFLAPAVAAVRDPLQRLFDLLEQLALTVAHPQFQGMLFLDGGTIGPVRGRLVVLKMYRGFTCGIDQGLLLTLQQGTEKGQLLFGHVIVFRRCKQLLAGQGGHSLVVDGAHAVVSVQNHQGRHNTPIKLRRKHAAPATACVLRPIRQNQHCSASFIAEVMSRSNPSTAPAEPQRLLDEAALHCREQGASLTPIRRHVLRLLHDQPGGVKAYELLDMMKQEHPNATPPTVYRALEFLIEQGLAHRIGKTNQFVPCNQHHHQDASLFLMCPDCGKVTELHDDQAVQSLTETLLKAGHTLAGPEIEISALCSGCHAGRTQEN